MSLAVHRWRRTSYGPRALVRIPGSSCFRKLSELRLVFAMWRTASRRKDYVVIAPELFHRTAPPGFEGDYKDFSLMMPHIKAVTTEAAEADIHATHDWLLSNSQVQQNKISSVGFCMGGRISFIANSVVPLRAAVSFYGSGIATGLLDRAARLHGPALLIWGGLDKHITADHRSAVANALTEQRKPHVSVVFSDADHAFFCDQRAAYKPDAARQAWALTLEFLRS